MITLRPLGPSVIFTRCPSALELTVSSGICQPGGQSPVLARGVDRHPKLRVDLNVGIS